MSSEGGDQRIPSPSVQAPRLSKVTVELSVSEEACGGGLLDHGRPGKGGGVLRGDLAHQLCAGVR